MFAFVQVICYTHYFNTLEDSYQQVLSLLCSFVTGSGHLGPLFKFFGDKGRAYLNGERQYSVPRAQHQGMYTSCVLFVFVRTPELTGGVCSLDGSLNPS